MVEVLKMKKTPLEVYNNIKGENSFLLESAEVNKENRYTILGTAEGKITFEKGRLKVESFSELSDYAKDLEGKYNCPLEALREVRNELREHIELPKVLKFKGGLVGYLGYDIVRYWIDLKGNTVNDLKFPDVEFFIVKNFIAFDLKEEKIYLIAEDLEKLNELKKILEEEREVKENTPNIKLNIESNMSKDEFISAVERAKEYIFAGDIFQVVLSRRIKVNIDGLDTFLIYKKVREINPSPYMYYLDFGERKIIGSSPEILVKTNENREVITRPIAGTIRRGKDEKEDKELERILLNDEKERAEHVMLVDLARNDIGKISKYGSVKVTEFMKIEKYSHVQHIVSNVIGKLKDKYDSFLAVKATFPAGTLSGAPKVRAMEIIDELEKSYRGPYGGGVGYFSWDDVMDMAITIRTYVVKKDNAYIQVGAGIVADSIPEKNGKRQRERVWLILRH
ncbi:anthranilate synthase component I [Methanocaldococcus villosus KIN24-T80]|uniref:Anthranilate synthase component 1 n=1 Tax=Methanocaldococcus villosus KIN24-T80 TaxID=1069083 RepID=N6V1R5_9EURY|nr:anthranilate synthase component I [Methanocaldococcus villosus KIN24-T80]